MFVPSSIQGTCVGWFLVGSGSPAIGAVRGAEVWASDDGTSWGQEVVVPLDDRDAQILDVSTRPGGGAASSEQGAGEGSAMVALRDRVILTGWEDDAAFALVGPIPG